MQPQDPQDSSIFLSRLPPEIRLEIYSHLFYSTRLSFGQISKKSISGSSSGASAHRANAVSVPIRPALNSLGLLRVCRKINGEIGHSWISQVLFCFGGAHAMLEKLTALEPSMLPKLRDMRISGTPPMLSIQSDPPTIECGWVHVFRALPGLCLDRLTVLGSYVSSATADLSTTEQLIEHGDGWKELCIISHNSAILEITKGHRQHGRRFSVPRLSRLNRALVRCDWPTASVSIYRSIHAAERGVMISKPPTREALFSWVHRSTKVYLAPYNASPSRHEDMEKEVLVLARRGQGADCAVKQLASDVRDVKVVKRRKRHNGRRHEDIIVDAYNNVDDYE